MKHQFEANRRNWNDRVPIHLEKNDIYDVEAFKAGSLSFVANEHIELEKFVDVNGKSLLHLQCHFELDTLSFARLGANVTDVDFSDVTIQTALDLADELQISAKFICANIYDLPEILDEKFDIASPLLVSSLGSPT